MTYQSAIAAATKWRQKNEKIVLVTGVFDVLHIEHLRFLAKAKNAGDRLLVGVESDHRVKQLKGRTRPLNPEAVRLEQVEALRSVDFGFVLPEQFSNEHEWLELLKTMKPSIYAASSHSSFQETKERLCHEAGVQFKIVHQFNPQFSTTKFAKLILKEWG